MRSRTIIGSLILVIIVTGSFLVFQPGAHASDPARESLDNPCSKKAKDGKMIWENLPHQFFSSL